MMLHNTKIIYYYYYYYTNIYIEQKSQINVL